MSKCQIVDCSEEGVHTELWRIGDARAFVLVCYGHTIEDRAGTRTSIGNNITRIEGRSSRTGVS